MAKNYSASFEKRGGYVFDRSSIISLWNISNKFLEKDSRLTLEFAGEHVIEATDVNELLDDIYVESKPIFRLKISGRNINIEPTRNLSINIKTEESFLSPLRVEIDGDRESCTVARSEIESVIDGCAKWYSRFLLPNHPLPAIAWMLAVPVFASISAGTAHTLFFGSPIGNNNVEISFLAESIILYILVLLLKRKLFPKIGFDIGRSSSVVRSAEIWRNVVFVGVILALVVGVVGGLIVERLK